MTSGLMITLIALTPSEQLASSKKANKRHEKKKDVVGHTTLQVDEYESPGKTFFVIVVLGS